MGDRGVLRGLNQMPALATAGVSLAARWDGDARLPKRLRRRWRRGPAAAGQHLSERSSSYEQIARSGGESFCLSLDRDHLATCEGPGYDAVILFLDELILWFASRAANPARRARKGEAAKLVEAESADRPIRS